MAPEHPIQVVIKPEGPVDDEDGPAAARIRQILDRTGAASAFVVDVAATQRRGIFREQRRQCGHGVLNAKADGQTELTVYLGYEPSDERGLSHGEHERIHAGRPGAGRSIRQNEHVGAAYGFRSERFLDPRSINRCGNVHGVFPPLGTANGVGATSRPISLSPHGNRRWALRRVKSAST